MTILCGLVLFCVKCNDNFVQLIGKLVETAAGMQALPLSATAL